MRTRLLTALLLAAAGTAAAGVFKYTGPDGRIQYTDRPVSGAEYVELPGGATAPSPPPEPQQPQVPDVELGPYETFEVALPEDGSTIRNQAGEVQLSLILIPPLQPEHRLQILVDGQPVPGDKPGTQVTLQGLVFGTHSLRAQILDDLDVPIAYTPQVTFHMRKPLPEGAAP
jgi:hypothetical protein